MILYRPHRALLSQSMELMKKFNTIDDMKAYVQDCWNGGVCTVDEMGFNDDRIGWHNTHYVLIDGDCIGMCNLEEG